MHMDFYLHHASHNDSFISADVIRKLGSYTFTRSTQSLTSVRKSQRIEATMLSKHYLMLEHLYLQFRVLGFI